MKQRVGSMRKVLSALSTHTLAPHMPVFVFCLCFFSQGIDGERERERYVHFVFDVTIIYRSGFENVVFFFREKKEKTEKRRLQFFFRFVYGIRRLGERERETEIQLPDSIFCCSIRTCRLFSFFFRRSQKNVQKQLRHRFFVEMF